MKNIIFSFWWKQLKTMYKSAVVRHFRTLSVSWKMYQLSFRFKHFRNDDWLFCFSKNVKTINSLRKANFFKNLVYSQESVCVCVCKCAREKNMISKRVLGFRARLSKERKCLVCKQVNNKTIISPFKLQFRVWYLNWIYYDECPGSFYLINSTRTSNPYL